MALRRCNVSQSAVTVFVDVPAHELQHPQAGGSQVAEATARIDWSIFQDPEEGLKLCVVIRYPRSIVRRLDLQFAQLLQETRCCAAPLRYGVNTNLKLTP